MREELKPTVSRLIERRQMQLDEMEVLQAIHEKKKEKATTKEDLAKCEMTLSKLVDARKEIVEDIQAYQDLL